MADGSDYQKFDSLEAFEEFFVRLLQHKRYTKEGILGAKTIEDYAGALKRGGYFEDGYAKYVNGMKRWSRESVYGDAERGGAPVQNVEIGDVTIHVTEPNATPEQMYQETMRAFTDALRRQQQSNIAQFGYAGG